MGTQTIHFFTLFYYHILNFCEGIRQAFYNQFTRLRNEVFEDGEIVYKAYIHTYKINYYFVYNHDTWYYIMYAYLLKLFGMSYLRQKETTIDISLQSRANNIIVYLKDGELHHKMQVIAPNIDNNERYFKDDIRYKNNVVKELPEAMLVLIDGMYDVTREYNLFRKTLLAANMGLMIMKVLFAYKYHTIPDDIDFGEITILTKETLKEIVFKKYMLDCTYDD